ncbi:MAG: GntR family transcriptional regulator [Lachnospiraceae bacterium]|nr:GntR family transcriptional regulator [Lachnospiraceae bacterium]
MQTDLDAFLPLRDVVFKTLRQAILTGELKPGERLMEIHLAEKLGVSRTPIREAIRQLELEGLVVMIPRRGAQVAHITEKSMSDVLEVRLALDELAVELACERITDEEIEALREACASFEEAVSSSDIHKITSADVSFHDIIFKASRNNRLVQMVNNLAEQMYRYRFEYIKDDSGWNSLITEHRMITDAIAMRDAGLAGRAIHVHIKNQENSIIRTIRREEKERLEK